MDNSKLSNLNKLSQLCKTHKVAKVLIRVFLLVLNQVDKEEVEVLIEMELVEEVIRIEEVIIELGMEIKVIKIIMVTKMQNAPSVGGIIII